MLAFTSGAIAQPKPPPTASLPGMAPPTPGPPNGFQIDGDIYANVNGDSAAVVTCASDWFDSTVAGCIVSGVGVLKSTGFPLADVGKPKDTSDAAFNHHVLTIANQVDRTNSPLDDVWGGGIKLNDTSHYAGAGIVLNSANNKSDINHGYLMVSQEATGDF